MAVLSIDLGGSHIACGVVQGDTIMASSSMATSAQSLGEALDPIAQLLRDCVRRSGIDPKELSGVALGYCGVVNGSTGEILSTLNKYVDAPSLDLHGWAEQEFHLPLRMENDACLALLGEAYAGAARGTSDAVMLTLGTGIGGAAMLGGKLLRSSSGQAGCLGGHLPVNFRGRLCSCGAVGCAEAEASTAVLPLLCHEHPRFGESSLLNEKILNFETLFTAADAGDAVASEIIAHCVLIWSVLTVGLIHSYGPELVVFGGGVMQRGEQLLAPIREHVAAHMWRTSKGVPRIVSATLGSQAALVGGTRLFIDVP
jgi:glucokinase